MRIAVFGAGGVGSYFGGRLAQAGVAVVFIARGRHLAALREGGLRVESLAGDFVLDRVSATDGPGEVGPVDAVLVGPSRIACGTSSRTDGGGARSLRRVQDDPNTRRRSSVVRFAGSWRMAASSCARQWKIPAIVRSST